MKIRTTYLPKTGPKYTLNCLLFTKEWTEFGIV